MRYVLAYDADCGPCARFKNFLEFLDASRRIDYRSLHEAEQEGLLDSIPASSRFSSAHLRLPDGSTVSRADLLTKLAELLPGGRVLSWMMASQPTWRRTALFAYEMGSRLHSPGRCGSE